MGGTDEESTELCSATLSFSELPAEIVLNIARLLYLEYGVVLLQILRLVCKTWRNIVKPGVISTLFLNLNCETSSAIDEINQDIQELALSLNIATPTINAAVLENVSRCVKLRSLEIPFIHQSALDSLASSLASKTLQSVDITINFQSTPETSEDNWISWVKNTSLSQLTHLSIASAVIKMNDQSHLTSLTYLANISSLKLARCTLVTGESLPTLESLTKLSSLSIIPSILSQSEIHALIDNLPVLRHLECSHNEATSAIAVFDHQDTLDSISLDISYFPFQEYFWFFTFDQHADPQSPRQSPRQPMLIKHKQQALTSITITKQEYMKIAFPISPQMKSKLFQPHIQSLDIGSMCLLATDIMCLSPCTSLRHLSLNIKNDDVGLKLASLWADAKLSSLTSLNLNGNARISPEEYSIIFRSMANLSDLELKNIPGNAKTILSSLGHSMSKLKRLRLVGCPLTETAAGGGVHGGDMGTALAAATNLRCLHIKWSGGGKEDDTASMRAVAHAVPCMPWLNELVLCVQGCVDGDCVAQFARSVSKSTNLRSLIVEHRGVSSRSPPEMGDLADCGEAWSQLASLEHLQHMVFDATLGWNADALHAVFNNSNGPGLSLRSITLKETGIKGAGRLNIDWIKAVSKLPRLVELTVDRLTGSSGFMRKITRDGFGCLYAATGLTKLEIRGGGVDGGAEELKNALPNLAFLSS